MRYVLLFVSLCSLVPFVGCNDELAVGDEWPKENGTYIGAGMPQDVPASPMQYVTVPQQSYCRPGDACYQPQQQSGQVQQQQYRSYRATPVRNFGSRVRGFFGRIFCRRGGC